MLKLRQRIECGFFNRVEAVQVPLRGGDVLVTESLLDDDEVGAAGEQPRRVRMPQLVEGGAPIGRVVESIEARATISRARRPHNAATVRTDGTWKVASAIWNSDLATAGVWSGAAVPR